MPLVLDALIPPFETGAPADFMTLALQPPGIANQIGMVDEATTYLDGCPSSLVKMPNQEDTEVTRGFLRKALGAQAETSIKSTLSNVETQTEEEVATRHEVEALAAQLAAALAKIQDLPLRPATSPGAVRDARALGAAREASCTLGDQGGNVEGSCQGLATPKSSSACEDQQPVEPTRPPSAFFLFVKEKREVVARAFPGISGASVTKLNELWGNMEPAEKRGYEERAKSLEQEYKKQMQAYRDSESYKNIRRMMGDIHDLRGG
jgi:hypothetical protein